MIKHLPCLFHPFMSVGSPPFPLTLTISLSRPLPLFSPSLLSLFVMFLGGGAFPSATMESCILQPQLSPEWVHLLSRLLLRITVLLQVPSFSQTHTHTHTNQWTDLWSGFVYDRERQYRDCFRVVSSHEMYCCHRHVLYVWAVGWSHFGKLKISYRMTSSGIKVKYQR